VVRVSDRGDAGERRVELRLPYASAAAAEAREAVEGRLRHLLEGERLADVKLLTDELVTNAVRHARPERDGTVGLAIHASLERVRIVVTDGGPPFEWATRAVPELGRGFGLVLVDRVADRWGLSMDGRKAVWFEIDVGTSRPSG
jgi:anti-sigma regulatory factor (Ser/Thr protein kinase)